MSQQAARPRRTSPTPTNPTCPSRSPKKWWAIWAILRKNFSFTATLDTTKIRQGSAYTTAGDGAALTDTGFTLRSGGSVTLTHLRADQTLTLTETDPGDHTVSWQLNGDDGPTGATCTMQVPRAQPAEITCINTRNVGIPTGLHTGAAPYLALVGLCWLDWRLLRCREV